MRFFPPRPCRPVPAALDRWPARRWQAIPSMARCRTAWRKEERIRAPPASVSFPPRLATLEFGTETPVLTALGEVRSAAHRWNCGRLPRARSSNWPKDSRNGGRGDRGPTLLRIGPGRGAIVLRYRRRRPARRRERKLAEGQPAALDFARDPTSSGRTGAGAELRQRALTLSAGPAGARRRQRLCRRGQHETGRRDRRAGPCSAAARRWRAPRRASRRAETALTAAVSRLAEAERRLTRHHALNAEFYGVLFEVDVVAGRLVNRNEQVARLIDPDALEVAFRISTAHITCG